MKRSVRQNFVPRGQKNLQDILILPGKAGMALAVEQFCDGSASCLLRTHNRLLESPILYSIALTCEQEVYGTRPIWCTNDDSVDDTSSHDICAEIGQNLPNIADFQCVCLKEC